MNGHFFLLSSPVLPECPGGIGKSLRFFFVQLYPETLMHQKGSEIPTLWRRNKENHYP